jgi:hypothetical protein
MGEKSSLEKIKKNFQKSIDICLQCGIMIIEKRKGVRKANKGKKK